MEEYLQNMKNLRSQMNDFEDQATNISVEEQKQKTAIQTMENDLQSVKSESRRLREETDRMLTAKAQTLSQIVEKKKKILSLETESSTLSRTLELLQQEKVSFSANLKDKRTYYAKVKEDINAKLQEQQDWLSAQKINRKVEEKTYGQTGKQSCEIHSIKGDFGSQGVETNEKYKDLMTRLEPAKAKLEDITTKTSKLATENSEKKEIIEQFKLRLHNFPPELKAMDIEALEEEHKALLSDKAGEMEYLLSLLERIEQIKVINCRCGKKYTVQLSS
ncbi:tropomyosin isoform X2 [Tasmannia lanceolata]|uniref:tropomyosin isoform X2 n=1 Tax=Tasmannia lanceolata TaxID=3420 RepID=UPI0040634402